MSVHFAPMDLHIHAELCPCISLRWAISAQSYVRASRSDESASLRGVMSGHLAPMGPHLGAELWLLYGIVHTCFSAQSCPGMSLQ